MQVCGTKIQPGQTGHEAAWQLLEDMYCRHTGQPLPQVTRTERGKPCFVQGGLHFSLTHTDRHAFCVLSRKIVGIDAEELDRSIRPELADKILSEGEKNQLEAAADRRIALLKFWVLKEAQAKCTGEGLRGYPNRTDFSLTDPRLRMMNDCVVAIIEEDDHVV